MDPQKKKMMLIGGIVFLVLLLGAYFMFAGKKTQQSSSNEAIPTNTVIPTIDDSVLVDLRRGNIKGEAILSIKNAPAGTTAIEFQFSYNAQVPGEPNAALQGAVGNCTETQGVWECGEDSPTGRKIVFGTCSSGVCRYHNIIGKIKVSLLFKGSYGEKIYEKEFEI